jgi:hypothetical protein
MVIRDKIKTVMVGLKLQMLPHCAEIIAYV